jgi:hypothetical protein
MQAHLHSSPWEQMVGGLVERVAMGHAQLLPRSVCCASNSLARLKYSKTSSARRGSSSEYCMPTCQI